MKCVLKKSFFQLLVRSVSLLSLCMAVNAWGFDHHHPPVPPPPAPVIVKPPVPVPVIPARPVIPPPSVQNAKPSPEQAARIAAQEKAIKEWDTLIQQRQNELALIEEEISDKEGILKTLDERIDIFSQEKEQLLAERDDIRNSLESFRSELTDNDFFMKVGVNMRTYAIPGYPITTRMIDYWVENIDRALKNLPRYIEYLQKEYVDPNQAKLQAWLEFAAGQPASQREVQEEWGRRKYEPILANYEKQMQNYRDKIKDYMEVKDRLLAMRPTIAGADDRIHQIELRTVELDGLINTDIKDRKEVTGLDAARSEKAHLEKAIALATENKKANESTLKTLKESIAKGSDTTAKQEPVVTEIEEKAPEPELKLLETEIQPKEAEPAPEAPAIVQTDDGASDNADKRAQLQQDIEYHMRNKDRAEAELKSIRQRPGTEAQQADLKARIEASEEFALAAGRELTRIGGSVSDYVKEDLSDYDPYKLNQTDLKLMDLTARAKAEEQATEQLIKTREFIRNNTDLADAMDLIQKLDRIAGFDNQTGLKDFERLDAVREFRNTVYETRTLATYSEQTLEATLANIRNAEYEVGAYRVQVGSTIAIGLGTGGLGMAAMAGEAGLVTMAAGTTVGLAGQAAAAGNLLLVYNVTTGTISGYASKGLKGAAEGAGKEVLPINTYIAVRDGKGAGSIAVGLWQDAGNILQIHSFAKSVKAAFQAKTVANIENSLSGTDAAMNRSWNLEQAHLDFLSTQMSAQTTVVNTTETQKPATGSFTSGPTKTKTTSTSSASPALPADQLQAKSRDLIQKLDGTINVKTRTAALTPTQKRQVEIIRGMSEGKYSAIVADKLLIRETGQGLTQTMALLSGTVN